MTIQIAVKVPEDLLRQIDDLVAAGRFPNRSAAVRAGIAAVAVDARRQEVDRAFQQGFTRSPERRTEMDDARRLAIDAIEDEPWEPWW